MVKEWPLLGGKKRAILLQLTGDVPRVAWEKKAASRSRGS